MNAAEALLSHVVDYAGLFPPAGLTMERAVREYRRYLRSDPAWMLGNFIVPANRLSEFAQTFSAVCCDEKEPPWTITVLCVGGNPEVDVRAIASFQQGAVFISAFEARAQDTRSASRWLDLLPHAQSRYIEFPPDRAEEFLPMLDAHDARAKIRTGGVLPQAIPTPETVARFLIACAEQGVSFKATAGLHHALRGERRLTYDTDSPAAKMHGFLNLLLAATLAWAGSTQDAIVKTLDIEDPRAFRLESDSVHWNDQRVTVDQIRTARGRFVIGFGSCSFTEPLDNLQEMHWIPAVEKSLR